MLKFIFKISILFFFICASSCNSQEQKKEPVDIEGFKRTETGLYYKFHKRGSGEKANKGDILIGEIKEIIGDELISDNSQFPGPFGRADDPMFPGDITEGYQMLSVGDSVSFLVNLDSLAKLNPEVLGRYSGNFLTVSVRLDSIINRRLYDSLYAYADVIKDSLFELDRSQAEALIESGKDQETKLIKAYIKKNNIKEQPNALGVYVIEKEKGSGKKIRKGDVVTMNYIGKLLTGEIFDTSIESIAEAANIIFPQRIFAPIQFRVGNEETIPGIDLGIIDQRVGSKLILIIPSEAAFGVEGNADVAEFTPVIFEIEILERQ